MLTTREIWRMWQRENEITVRPVLEWASRKAEGNGRMGAFGSVSAHDAV